MAHLLLASRESKWIRQWEVPVPYDFGFNGLGFWWLNSRE